MEDKQKDAQLRALVRDVLDFPKPGIVFKDISPLLGNPEAYRIVIEHWRQFYKCRIDVIVALDSRGFLFGPLLAQALNVPFVMVRKAGKLPGLTERVSYELEYGTAELEIQLDAFPRGSRVLVLDDVLATGGTAKAACTLVERLGGDVDSCAFLIELSALKGRSTTLSWYEVYSLLKYE